MLLIARRKFSANHKHNRDLKSDASSVWNFCASFSIRRHFVQKPVVASAKTDGAMCFSLICFSRAIFHRKWMFKKCQCCCKKLELHNNFPWTAFIHFAGNENPKKRKSLHCKRWLNSSTSLFSSMFTFNLLFTNYETIFFFLQAN